MINFLKFFTFIIFLLGYAYLAISAKEKSNKEFKKCNDDYKLICKGKSLPSCFLEHGNSFSEKCLILLTEQDNKAQISLIMNCQSKIYKYCKGGDEHYLTCIKKNAKNIDKKCLPIINEITLKDKESFNKKQNDCLKSIEKSCIIHTKDSNAHKNCLGLEIKKCNL